MTRTTNPLSRDNTALWKYDAPPLVSTGPVDLDLVEEKPGLSDRRTEWDFGLLEAQHLVFIF